MEVFCRRAEDPEDRRWPSGFGDQASPLFFVVTEILPNEESLMGLMTGPMELWLERSLDGVVLGEVEATGVLFASRARDSPDR